MLSLFLSCSSAKPRRIRGGTIYSIDKRYSDYTPNSIITADQMRRMGWKKFDINELNACCAQFSINTSPRIRHFIAQASHESNCGLWTKELSDGKKYNGRTDIGNVNPGDGPKYKGGGYLHITGRYNYQKFANFIGDQNVMLGVDYLAAHYPWQASGFWWMTNNMNSYIDRGATVEQVSRKVNGGTNGLADRIAKYKLACTIF